MKNIKFLSKTVLFAVLFILLAGCGTSESYNSELEGSWGNLSEMIQQEESAVETPPAEEIPETVLPEPRQEEAQSIPAPEQHHEVEAETELAAAAPEITESEETVAAAPEITESEETVPAAEETVVEEPEPEPVPEETEARSDAYDKVYGAGDTAGVSAEIKDVFVGWIESQSGFMDAYGDWTWTFAYNSGGQLQLQCLGPEAADETGAVGRMSQYLLYSDGTVSWGPSGPIYE